MDKFWMVYNKTSGNSPRVVHNSYHSALKEAKRLAKLNVGSEFVVLGSEVVAKAELPVVVTQTVDIPF